MPQAVNTAIIANYTVIFAKITVKLNFGFVMIWLSAGLPTANIQSLDKVKA